MNHIKLMTATAALLALAIPVYAAHAQVTWKPPVTYTGNGTTFTAATLPGSQVIAQGMTMPVFTIPSPATAGLPRVPQLACFEADGPGGLMVTAPSGTWIGIPANGGSVTLLQYGSGCIWTDGKNWHLR